MKPTDDTTSGAHVHHCTADEAFDRLHDVATAFVATHTRPAATT
jgi:hypothetical protein